MMDGLRGSHQSPVVKPACFMRIEVAEICIIVIDVLLVSTVVPSRGRECPRIIIYRHHYLEDEERCIPEGKAPPARTFLGVPGKQRVKCPVDQA